MCAQFFPDQFILPTDAWQWKLSWSKALPDDATVDNSAQLSSSAPEAQPTPSGQHPPSLAVRAFTPPDAWAGLSVHRVSLTGSLITADAIAAFKACLDPVTNSAALSMGGDTKQGGLVTSAPRAILLSMDSDAGALVLPAPLASAWAACVTALEQQTIPTFIAFDHVLNGVALELALACSHRLAGPHSSVRFSGWHREMVPGARSWQLARSAGAGSASWLFLTTGDAKIDQLVKWGAVERVVTVAAAEEITDAAILPMLEDVLRVGSRSSAAAVSAAERSSDAKSDGELESAMVTRRQMGNGSDTVSGAAMATAKAELAADGRLPADFSRHEHMQRMRELIDVQEALELRRRTAWLMLRLPQLEHESSTPLLQQHMSLIPDWIARGDLPMGGGETQHMGPLPALLSPLGESSRSLNAEALSVPTLRVLRQDGVVQITISRKSHANAYNSEMLSALERLVPTHRAHTLSARSTPHCMLVPSCHCRAYVHERVCVCVCAAGADAHGAARDVRRLSFRGPALLLLGRRPRARQQPARRGRPRLAVAAGL